MFYWGEGEWLGKQSAHLITYVPWTQGFNQNPLQQQQQQQRIVDPHPPFLCPFPISLEFNICIVEQILVPCIYLESMASSYSSTKITTFFKPEYWIPRSFPLLTYMKTQNLYNYFSNPLWKSSPPLPFIIFIISSHTFWMLPFQELRVKLLNQILKII